ncbi:hypothetical protein BGP76_19235 [Reichenbachiella sp. MSK19-1]|nr:hypothetical protein BGP76_19235 [Reichenbachiella sp. MSK19-1]
MQLVILRSIRLFTLFGSIFYKPLINLSSQNDGNIIHETKNIWTWSPTTLYGFVPLESLKSTKVTDTIYTANLGLLEFCSSENASATVCPFLGILLLPIESVERLLALTR